MSRPHVLETVAAELRRQGLPSADVARLLQELDDHIADLFEEQGGCMDGSVQMTEQIESRLGQPEVLVAAALANRRQASILARHPILTFVVAPIPLVILSWISFLFVFFGLLKLVGIEGRAVRDWPAVLVYALSTFEIALRFLPPAGAAALLCWCAARAGMSWKWTLTASCLIALVAGAMVVQVKLPVEPGQGQILLGLGWPVHHWINLIQLMVPIAVGAAFLWGTRSQAVVRV